MDEVVSYVPNLAVVERIKTMTDFESLIELKLLDHQSLNNKPGQFAQISVMGYGEAPISICSAEDNKKSFEICVRGVGTTSKAMRALRAGDEVGVRGPFGKGFPIDEMVNKDIFIVAGGIGIAPLRSLIQHLISQRGNFGRVIIIYGAKSPANILFREDIKVWSKDPSLEIKVIVDLPDKTWRGPVGVVTVPLRDLDIKPSNSCVVAAVGPHVMYKFVAMEFLNKGLTYDQIYFSLERRFKCGIGKCGHCQLNDLYVCNDGPVFQYVDLLSRTEAIEAWAPEPDQF